MATTTDIQEAKNAALRYLAYRPRTCREISDKLTQLGYKPRAVRSTMAALKRLGLVDDFDYSLRWAKHRIGHNPKSPWMITQELKDKGVSGETIEKAVNEAFAGVDLGDLAGRVLRKQYGGRVYLTSEKAKIKKRMFDFLMRRGFGRELAFSASEHVLSECLDWRSDHT